MSDKNTRRDLLQIVANIAQVLSLPIALASWIWPSFFADRKLSPCVVRIVFTGLVVALFVLPVIKLIASQFQRVRKEKRDRAFHNKRQRDLARWMGLGLASDCVKLAIDKYFVEPSLRLRSSEEPEPSGEGWAPRAVLRHAVDHQQDGVLVWGMAGSGKSALAQWLAWEIAAPRAPMAWRFLERSVPVEDDRINPRLKGLIEIWARFMTWLGLMLPDHERRFPYPFLVTLQGGVHKFNTPGAEVIVNLLGQCCQESNVLSLLHRRLVIPIFDGLDELDESSQKTFLKSLRAFMLEYPGNAPFVLTVREPVLSDMQVSTWQILPFSESQIRRYIKQYFEGQSGPQRTRGVPGQLLDTIYATAQSKPQVWEVLSEPLLLGLITFAFDPRSTVQLATDRTTIYQEYLKALANRHRRDEAGQVPRQPTVEVDPDGILGKLAYRLMEMKQYRAEHSEALAAKKQLEEVTGILTWHEDTKGYRFCHTVFQTFFAATYLAQAIKHGPPDESQRLWETAVSRGLGRSITDNATSEGAPDEAWAAHWRETLTFAVGLMTPKEVDLSVQETFPYRNALQLYQQGVYATERILASRLLNAIRERVQVWWDDLDQTTLVAALREMLPRLPRSWYRDIWEAGHLLTEQGWCQLRAQVVEVEPRAQVLHLLEALRTEKAAEILIDLACSAPKPDPNGKISGRVAPDIAATIRALGIVAAAPLARAYNHARLSTAEDVERLAIIIELMGHAGYATSTWRILKTLVDARAPSSTMPQALIAEAYKAVARWGEEGAETMRALMRRSVGMTPALRNALTEALVLHPVNDELVEQLRAYLQERGARQELAVQVVQGKLRSGAGSESDRHFFQRLLECDLLEYQHISRTRWRRILHWLEVRRLGYGRKWPARVYGGIYDWLRAQGKPSPGLLQSMIQIAAELDDEVSERWIEAALQDPCFEARSVAIDAFVRRSRRAADRDSWLDRIAGDLTPSLVSELRQKLADNSANTQQTRNVRPG